MGCADGSCPRGSTSARCRRVCPAMPSYARVPPSLAPHTPQPTLPRLQTAECPQNFSSNAPPMAFTSLHPTSCCQTAPSLDGTLMVGFSFLSHSSPWVSRVFFSALDNVDKRHALLGQLVCALSVCRDGGAHGGGGGIGGHEHCAAEAPSTYSFT